MYSNQNPYEIKAMNNHAVIEVIPDAEIVNGLYVVPSTDKKDFVKKGKIISSTQKVTDRLNKELYESLLKKDDIVLYDKRSAQFSMTWKGNLFHIVRTEDIFCIVGEEK